MSFIKLLHCAKSCLCLVSCPRFTETEVFLGVIDGNYVCWGSQVPALLACFSYQKIRGGFLIYTEPGRVPSFQQRRFTFLPSVRQTFCAKTIRIRSTVFRTKGLWSNRDWTALWTSSVYRLFYINSRLQEMLWYCWCMSLQEMSSFSSLLRVKWEHGCQLVIYYLIVVFFYCWTELWTPPPLPPSIYAKLKLTCCWLQLHIHLTDMTVVSIFLLNLHQESQCICQNAKQSL